VVTIRSWEAGPANLLILYTDGSVRCTGGNTVNQCGGVPDRDALSVGEGLTDLAMGDSHGTAVVNGGVLAWGFPESGSLNVPDDARTGVIDVASGIHHNVAVKRINATTTQLIRWGLDLFGLGSPPARSDIVAVSANNFNMLALTSSGGVLQWGDNRRGQAAVPDEAASGIVAIAAGHEHGMALTSAGRVLAWGGTDGQSNVPVEAQSDVIKIGAGFKYCVALRNDGRVIAWCAYGGDFVVQPVPITPPGMESGVDDVAALFNQFVARKQDGSIASFGEAIYDVLGFPVVL
jgi:alpha-tubulin suppressor-like RCC1 family protein